MRFNDTGNTHDSLVHYANFLVNTDNTSYPLADKAQSANRWVGIVQGWIHEVSGGFEFDDPNYADFPYTTFHLVDSQRDYALPAATDGGDATTLLSVIGISVKNSAGIWSKLSYIEDWTRLGVDRYEYLKNAGMPTNFDLFGNSMWLFCPPSSSSVTLTSGGRVYFSRAAQLFTASSTTDQPPFVSIFHQVLSFGMAYDYALAKGLDGRSELAAEIWGGVVGRTRKEGYEMMIKKHYSTRNKSQRARITPHRSERGQYR